MECLAPKHCASSFFSCSSPIWDTGLCGILFFFFSQMSSKDISCQSPSWPKWSLYKSCGSDSLHLKGSLVPAPAQPLLSQVTLINVGSPLGGLASSPLIVKVELVICYGVSWMPFIHSFIQQGFVEHLICASYHSIPGGSMMSKPRPAPWCLDPSGGRDHP